MIEEEAPKPGNRFAPASIDNWGVTELRQYISALQAEITRAERAIASREAHRGAADAFFRRPSG